MTVLKTRSVTSLQHIVVFYSNCIRCCSVTRSKQWCNIEHDNYIDFRQLTANHVALDEFPMNVFFLNFSEPFCIETSNDELSCESHIRFYFILLIGLPGRLTPSKMPFDIDYKLKKWHCPNVANKFVPQQTCRMAFHGICSEFDGETAITFPICDCLSCSLAYICVAARCVAMLLAATMLHRMDENSLSRPYLSLSRVLSVSLARCLYCCLLPHISIYTHSNFVALVHLLRFLFMFFLVFTHSNDSTATRLCLVCVCECSSRCLHALCDSLHLCVRNYDEIPHTLNESKNSARKETTTTTKTYKKRAEKTR